MLFSRNHSSLTLLALGFTLAAGNLWVTLARSTMPLPVDGVVAEKRKLLEKKLGVDDVFLLHFQNGKTLQVDRHVFDRVSEGSVLHKPAWLTTLKVNGRSHELQWSLDFHRMAFVMPLAAVVLLAMCAIAIGRPIPAGDEQTPR